MFSLDTHATKGVCMTHLQQRSHLYDHHPREGEMGWLIDNITHCELLLLGSDLKPALMVRTPYPTSIVMMFLIGFSRPP